MSLSMTMWRWKIVPQPPVDAASPELFLCIKSLVPRPSKGHRLLMKAVAERVVANVRSMGMALTPCVMPASGKAGFELEEGEMEVGIGIHGEPGIERKPVARADAIAEELTGKVLSDLDFSGSDVAVMVNGMGATPEMELFLINKKVQSILHDKGIHVYRTFVGDYMTSMEMAGCSVTLLKLDEEMKELLDATSDAPAFRI